MVKTLGRDLTKNATSLTEPKPQRPDIEGQGRSFILRRLELKHFTPTPVHPMSKQAPTLPTKVHTAMRDVPNYDIQSKSRRGT